MKVQKLFDFKIFVDGNIFLILKNVGEMVSSFFQLKFKYVEYYRII